MQLDGDDSLFMEANTLASVFSKVADSFAQLTCKYLIFLLLFSKE
jgi:hypothetical protein